MKIHRSSFRTRHFDFEAFGATRADARAALGRGFAQHAKEYGLRHDWHHGSGLYLDEELELDVCYRGSEELAGSRVA